MVLWSPLVSDTETAQYLEDSKIDGLGVKQLGEEVKEALPAQSDNRFNRGERSPSAAESSFTDGAVMLTKSFMVKEGLRSALE